jgi:hypothetical protein
VHKKSTRIDFDRLGGKMMQNETMNPENTGMTQKEKRNYIFHFWNNSNEQDENEGRERKNHYSKNYIFHFWNSLNQKDSMKTERESMGCPK